MPKVSTIASKLDKAAPEQLQRALVDLLPRGASHEERVSIITAALQSPMGREMRSDLGGWITDRLVPVERLVPEAYAAWRPPVRDAMLFVVSHLSDERLAPKLLEQLELPANTRLEERLLRLIAKVPGLQKLGQVIARNRHLRPALRKALSELENGIHDVDAPGVCAIIRQQLGSALDRFAVEIEPAVLSEASVSAVVRFTWRNPHTGVRERGVFKVLKPHIPLFFNQDMELLQNLAQFFGRKHHEYGPAVRLIPDTFRKVRRLLQHEVNFPREQKTLLEAWELYRRVRGVRIPRLMRPLCTATITAISEETGTKVTDAAARMPGWRRSQVADQLIEALVAVPLFASSEQSLFHADPHAGNLLYDSRTGELILIDWALRERLTQGQRRYLGLLFLMVALRDPVGASFAITALAERRIPRRSRQGQTIHHSVSDFLDRLPLAHLPSAVDAMRLLEEVALKGIRFPAALIMLSKVLFTLDGILQDIGGTSASMGLVMARHIARHWLTDRKAFASPLTRTDWITVQCSALLYGSRLWLKGEQAIVNRFLSATSAADRAPAEALQPS
ncbi:MAG TPA: AarF/UbiB family protein [Terriglobales bacterium]|nr:AarF/UbiB family protein [Terriglobales bacterium]